MAKNKVTDYNEVRTGSWQKAMIRYSLGRDKVREVGEEAGAVFKLGGRVLFDFVKMDEFMAQQTK